MKFAIKKQSALRRIHKAKTVLAVNPSFVFYSIMIFHLQIIEGGTTYGTLETDGKHLWFEPSFVDKLSDEELMGVLLHEVNHIVLMHPVRCQGREPRKWMMAIDFAVNGNIHQQMEARKNINDGLRFTLPDPHLHEEKWQGMSADAIYARLLQDPNIPETKTVWVTGAGDGLDGEGGDGHQHPGHGAGHCGGIREMRNPDGSKMNEADKIQAENELARNILSAAMSAKMQGQGHLPAGIEEIVKNLLTSKIAWQEYIHELMEIQTRDDYRIDRPNKKHLMSRIIMPSLYGKTINLLVMVADTSGSVSYEELVEYFSEMSGIMEQFQILQIIVICCDAKVDRVDIYEPEDLPVRAYRPTGRGGTSYRPPFEWIEENGYEPDMLIYFGDAEVSPDSFPDQEPDYPVIWASSGTTDEKHFPFGQVVEVTLRSTEYARA